jgi:hypothetical protein
MMPGRRNREETERINAVNDRHVTGGPGSGLPPRPVLDAETG